MKQGFVPLGKYCFTLLMASSYFSFATIASAQDQLERIPIDLGEDEVAEAEVESAEADPVQVEPKQISAQEALDAAETAYGPPKPKPCPKSDDPNVIIVCAQPQDDSEFRVKSSGELDPNDRSNRDGMPRAADIAGIAGPGIFTGPATVSGACLPGSCPPPMPVLIDLKAIPEAPEGSDADLIAKGEKRLD